MPLLTLRISNNLKLDPTVYDAIFRDIHTLLQQHLKNISTFKANVHIEDYTFTIVNDTEQHSFVKAELEMLAKPERTEAVKQTMAVNMANLITQAFAQQGLKTTPVVEIKELQTAYLG